MRTMDGVKRATGHERNEWFARLDAWGAPGRDFREIAAWLRSEHDLSKWWAQKLIVEYEQARGLRAPGVRRDGTYEVSASKTIDLPVERLFDMFIHSHEREKWLGDKKMSMRDSVEGRSARFDWEDGTSRVHVDITRKGPSKSTVVVAHRLLNNAEKAAALKSMWRERLADLKSFLES